MYKISFDYDDTLSNLRVQSFAYQLYKARYDVHIVTSRVKEKKGQEGWNTDLYLIADSVGIPKHKIHFMGLQPKFKFFQKNPQFLVHVDDDIEEVEEISNYSNTNGILFKDSYPEVCFKQVKDYILGLT